METTSSLFLKRFFHVLFKRKFQLFGFFLGAVATVAVAVLVTSKTMYQATSQIRLEVGREYISDLRLDTLGAVNRPEVRSDRDEQFNLASEIIRGYSLARRLVETFGAAELYKDLNEAKPWLHYLPEFLQHFFQPDELLSRDQALNAATARLIDHIEVWKTGDSPLINIGFSHEDPQMAAKVVNTLISIYLERHLAIHKNPRFTTFFENQFEKIKAELERTENELTLFKREHSISSSSADEKTLAIRKIEKLQVDLDDAQSQKKEIENRVGQLTYQLQNTTKNSQLIGALQDKLLALQLKEGELSLNFTNENPALQEVKNEISFIVQKLSEFGANQRYGSAGGEGASLYQNLQTEILKNEADLKALEGREETLKKQLLGYQSRLDDLNRLEARFGQLQQQFNLAQDSYRLYLTKFEELQISNAMDSEKIASVTVIEAARPPIIPVRSKSSLMLALAVFIGSVGGLGLAFMLELLNKTVDRREDVEELGLPVLASIPRLRLGTS